MKICQYCENGIFNENTTFCDRECQTEHMKEKRCLGCQKREFHWRGDAEEIGYCSKKCLEDTSRRMLAWNLQCMLGYGRVNRSLHNCFDLIEISYKIKNSETGEIIEQMIDFEEK